VSLFWDQPGRLEDSPRRPACMATPCIPRNACRFCRVTSPAFPVFRRLSGVTSAVRDRGRFSRAYWTPPLTPASAMRVERTQIENLGLRPLVSLTDHDNIDAGLALKDEPISVEWTVPYERSVLHLGIHNLPVDSARSWISVMAAYTSAAVESGYRRFWAKWAGFRAS